MNPLSTDEDNDGKRKFTLFEIRPYRPVELARFYKVDKKTFNRWLYYLRKELGPKEGQFFSIKQVEIIIMHLKLPYFIRVEIISEEDFERQAKPNKNEDNAA